MEAVEIEEVITIPPLDEASEGKERDIEEPKAPIDAPPAMAEEEIAPLVAFEDLLMPGPVIVDEQMLIS